jgi:hypothetical protein
LERKSKQNYCSKNWQGFHVEPLFTNQHRDLRIAGLPVFLRCLCTVDSCGQPASKRVHNSMLPSMPKYLANFEILKLEEEQQALYCSYYPHADSNLQFRPGTNPTKKIEGIGYDSAKLIESVHGAVGLH